MAVSIHRYLAVDYQTGKILAELPLTGVSYQRLLNQNGVLTGDLPIGDLRVAAMDIKGSTQPGRTLLYVDKGGVLTWGGMLWSRRIDTTGKKLQIQGSEMASLWAHRFLVTGHPFFTAPPTQTYTNADQGQILSDMVTKDLTRTGGTPFGFSVTIPTSTGILRSQTFNTWELRQILSEVTNLTTMYQGMDWAHDPAYSNTGAPGVAWTFSYPYRGVNAASAGTLVPMFDMPGNIESYIWPEDGTQSANQCWGVGGGSGATTLVSNAISTDLITNGWPLLERVGSYKTITDQAALNAKVTADLDAYATDGTPPSKKKKLKRKQSGLSVPILTVRTDSDPLLGQYTPGDECRVRITDEWFPMSGAAAGDGAGLDDTFRIVGYTVFPGDGTRPETVQISLGQTVS